LRLPVGVFLNDSKIAVVFLISSGFEAFSCKKKWAQILKNLPQWGFRRFLKLPLARAEGWNGIFRSGSRKRTLKTKYSKGFRHQRLKSTKIPIRD
jgi:hypothetical protein